MAEPGPLSLVPAALAGLLVAGLAFVAGAGLAWHHPLAPAAALCAFVLVCSAVAWRPRLWLFVVPAALPLLNFGPWTGWVAFEEFDLLLLGVAAGAYACLAHARRAACGELCQASRTLATADRTAFVALAVLFGALAVATLVRGFAAGGELSLGWFQGYTDPLNGWRNFKSLLFAGLMWPLLRREIRAGPEPAARHLASGMLVGLALVSLAAIWERGVYTGLWDFSSPYRTTALFWEMHVGGAAIDAYLALATPFVAWALWTARTPLHWAAAAALALLVGYACLTTFARGVYLAVGLSLALLGLLLARQRPGGNVRTSALRALRIAALLLGIATGLALAFDTWGWAGAGLLLLGLGSALLLWRRRTWPLRWRSAGSLALALALALEVVAVLGLGSYMRERIAASLHDRAGRLAHWQAGLGLLRGPGDWLLGLGLGRLPAAYAHGVAGQAFPGEVQFVPAAPGGPSASVRLLGPKTVPQQPALLALTQRVTLRPGAPYLAAFDVRARKQADVYVRLCEMHLLYPRHCQIAFVPVPAGDARSHRLALRLQGPALDAGRAWAPRLGVFSISVLNPGGEVELDNVSLVDRDRAELLANSGFAQGMARWFPAAQGNYVPWHIDNLYLELAIERGLPACLAFVLCMAIALRRLVGAAGREVPIAPFVAASLCGGLCVGLVSSVMDVPRVAFLLFLLALFAVEVTGAGRTARP